MDQISLTKGLLSQGYDVEIVILANCGCEVELTPRRTLVHQLVVVLVADLFLHQLVASVLLSVRSHFTRILCLDTSEVLNLSMFGLRLGTDFFVGSINVDFFGPLGIILA